MKDAYEVVIVVILKWGQEKIYIICGLKWRRCHLKRRLTLEDMSDLDPQGHMPAWVKQKQRKGNQGEAKAKPKLGLEKCPVDRYLMRIQTLVYTSPRQSVPLLPIFDFSGGWHISALGCQWSFEQWCAEILTSLMFAQHLSTGIPCFSKVCFMLLYFC